jgi:Holliday junction resolvase RusA-like endonuclease
LETFEFIVEGPAVSLKAKKTNAKRYQKWIRTVRNRAQEHWSDSLNPTHSASVIVHITNYYTLAPPDVDNIIKPILDAIETVAYGNDQQVYKVISEKFDLSNIDRIQNPSPLLAAGLVKYTELLHIIVTWDTEDE